MKLKQIAKRGIPSVITIAVIAMTTVNPVPARCQGQVQGTTGRTIPVSPDVELIRLSDRTWVHRSFQNVSGYGRVGANGLVVIDGSDAAIIDTPWNDKQTAALFDAVKDSLNASIRIAVVTHSHVDCMGGLAEVHRRGAVSYAYEKTRLFASRDNLPLPMNTFADSLFISCGNTEMQLFYPGGGHTVDNMVVWLPSSKTLFGGCLLKSMETKGLGNTADSDIPAWPVTVAWVMKRFPGAQIVIPGHGNFGGAELLTHTLGILETNGRKK